MESLAIELSRRTKKYVSVDLIEKCIRDKEYIEKRLESNYSLMLPISWSLKEKDMSAEDLINAYIKDIHLSKFANAALKDKSANCIRFATYNIHYWTNSYQTSNVKYILYVLKKLGADIVALQEALMPYNTATNDTRLSLLGSLDQHQPIPETNIDDIPLKNRSVHSSDNWEYENILTDISDIGFKYIASSAASTAHASSRTFFGNAIISNRQIKTAAGLTLPPYGQGRSATICLFPDVKIKNARTKGIIAVSVHLDAFDYSGMARRIQLKHLISYLNPKQLKSLSPGFKITNDTPIIIMGDFNSLKREDYIESEWDWLNDNNQGFNLDDETIKLIEDAGYEDVFHVQNPCCLKSSTWSSRRIDYIFIKGIPKESILHTYAYYSDDSDHIPLIVDIEIDQMG